MGGRGNEQRSRPEWPLPTSRPQAGQAGAKETNPTIASSLSKQPFPEGGCEYPVGYVSLWGARWALWCQPRELSCASPSSPRRPAPHRAAPSLAAQLSWTRLTLPLSLESQDFCIVQPDSRARLEMGGGGMAAQEGQGTLFLSEDPFSFQIPIPRANLRGSWGPKGR